MLRKILVVGMILFLFSGCLSHREALSEKTSSRPSPVKEESSLLNKSESEKISPPETERSQTEAFPPSPTPSLQEQTTKTLELPISDGSNDDFDLEILPGDRRQKELDFDIPIVINEKVEHFIQYFQTTAKNRFSSWLARSEKYVPFMRSLLKENGLPEDLVYMALIESGFNPYAYSRSKASGPWQFIYLTGKRYGLRSNWWIDERRDPEKSTIAAAKYLKDLYDMFECWYLAAAGYNAGEKKIVAAMQRYQTEDFWELAKYSYLKQETKDYVPQMIAAALIAKDPEKYGFVGIEYEEALRYEKVKVPDVTDLRLIARACDATVDEIRELNPELSRWCTPPDFPDYEIKIPFGKKELFSKNFGILHSGVKFQFKTHVVKKGESFPKIAKLYRIDVEPILEINRWDKKSRLSAGTNLLIPLPKDQDLKPVSLAKKESRGTDRGSKPVETTYTIKKGDSLWSIANEMGVNIGALGRWNHLHADKKLMPGDKLKIRIGETSRSSEEPRGKPVGKEMIYVVKKGDTLSSIARKFNLTVSEIKALNQLGKEDQIHPEDRLKLRVGGTKSSALN